MNISKMTKKFKDMLFEEEEVFEEVVSVKENNTSEVKIPILKPDAPVTTKIEIPPLPAAPVKNEATFFDFDDHEFEVEIEEPSVPVRQPSRTVSKPINKPVSKPEVRKNQSRVISPVGNFDSKAVDEKKYDYASKYEKKESIDVSKRKFKPSLVISPVYGILNEDYDPDDIKSSSSTPSQSENIDIDTVRRKAYGDDEIETLTQDVVEPKVVVSEKSKSIDDLLSQASDEKINIRKSNKKEDLEKTKEVPVKKIKEEKILVEEVLDEEGTFESDLYDLIDSMYESKEEEM